MALFHQLDSGILSHPNSSLRVKVREGTWGKVKPLLFTFSFFSALKVKSTCDIWVSEGIPWIDPVNHLSRILEILLSQIIQWVGAGTGLQIQVHMIQSCWARMEHSVLKEHQERRNYQSCVSQKARVPKRSMLAKVRNLSRQKMLLTYFRGLAQGLAYRFGRAARPIPSFRGSDRLLSYQRKISTKHVSGGD